jgi:hypothetical protein
MGDYRVRFHQDDDTIRILRVKNRREAYAEVVVAAESFLRPSSVAVINVQRTARASLVHALIPAQWLLHNVTKPHAVVNHEPSERMRDDYNREAMALFRPVFLWPVARVGRRYSSCAPTLPSLGSGGHFLGPGFRSGACEVKALGTVKLLFGRILRFTLPKLSLQSRSLL